MAEADGKPWDPDLYEGRHSFVWKAAADLLKLLDPRGSERILDLGCGTGQLTADIASTGAEVIGLDHSPAMIEQARRNYPHIRFERADGADFRVDAPMDAVFSNAALHWMTRPAAVAACVHAALRPGGRFVAELGGKGNVHGIHGALAEAIRGAGLTPLEESTLLYFPSVAEYARVLEDAGFRVTYATHFDRPIRLDGGAHGLRTWIGMFADRFLAVVPEDRRDALLAQVEDRLHTTLYHDDAWHADYVRLRIVAVK